MGCPGSSSGSKVLLRLEFGGLLRPGEDLAPGLFPQLATSEELRVPVLEDQETPDLLVPV